MKVRVGFVSNSSSSSFLIYGVTLGKEEIYKLLVKSGKIEKGSDEDDDEDDCDVYETLETALEGTDLEFHIPYEDDVYIGRSWDSVGDDETGKQFKERVKAQLAELFGKKKMSLETLQEAWRDG